MLAYIEREMRVSLPKNLAIGKIMPLFTAVVHARLYMPPRAIGDQTSEA